MWRAVDATDACIGAFNGSAVVTRDGKEHRCESPELDLRQLVDHGYWWARHELPRSLKRKPPRKPGDGAICEIEPDACPGEAGPRDPNAPDCPRYDGDD